MQAYPNVGDGLNGILFGFPLILLGIIILVLIYSWIVKIKAKSTVAVAVVKSSRSVLQVGIVFLIIFVVFFMVLLLI